MKMSGLPLSYPAPASEGEAKGGPSWVGSEGPRNFAKHRNDRYSRASALYRSLLHCVAECRTQG